MQCPGKIGIYVFKNAQETCAQTVSAPLHEHVGLHLDLSVFDKLILHCMGYFNKYSTLKLVFL